MDSAKAKLQGIHMSVTFEMIRLIIWQVPCSAELQGFHMSMTLSNCMLKVSNYGMGLVTWWTIGTLMLTNFLTIYIYFSHTLAGVVTTSFTLSYLLSNPLQPCSIVCTSLWIITKVLTLIC